MSSSQPHPVGDPVGAFRSTLKRAHRAEEKVRELRARLDALQARIDALEDE